MPWPDDSRPDGDYGQIFSSWESGHELDSGGGPPTRGNLAMIDRSSSSRIECPALARRPSICSRDALPCARPG